jgi:hypothetical protein
MCVEAPTLRTLSSTPQNSTSFLSTGYYHREQIPDLARVVRITVDEVKFEHVGETYRRKEKDSEAVHYRLTSRQAMAVALSIASSRANRNHHVMALP